MFLMFIILSMGLSCGNDPTEFAGKSSVRPPVQPSTASVCTEVPVKGRYIIVIDDGELAEPPSNILGVY
jgi:hypothetical protein